jgi:teichuronic acid biosynthesis glycosyltransferase TuaG
MNEMATQANGDYISVIDVDDLWMPAKLEKQSAFLGKYDVIGTFCRYFGERELDLPLIPEEIPLEKILQHNEIVNSSVLVRKELFRLDEEEKMVDDYELWLRLAKDGKSFYNVPETLTLHRIHSASKFNTLDHESIMKHINEIKLRLHIQPIDYL